MSPEFLDMREQRDAALAALDDLVHEYIALAVRTNQPFSYRRNLALVAASAALAKARGGSGEDDGR